MWIEELECDCPIERFLDTFEDQSHPATRDETGNFIALKDSPDQTIDRLVAGHRGTPIHEIGKGPDFQRPRWPTCLGIRPIVSPSATYRDRLRVSITIGVTVWWYTS